MLVNITHDTKAEHARLFGAGIAFLTAMALLIGLSIAIYNKTFTDPTMVTIKAQDAGLQLAKFGDVRRHGALVGHVREIGNDGKQAVIKVAFSPKAAKNIPENVTVEILPTTLFGQKYISIVDPSDPSDKALSDGDVIPSDRVTTNVELQKILADLFPLLRSIRPADLSSTLYALATALRGRGDRARRDHGQARRLPDHDERPPADAPGGPRPAREGQPDLRPRRPRPGQVAAQRDDHGAHRDREGAAARGVLRRRDGPGQDLDPGADHQRGQHRPCPCGLQAAAPPARHVLARVPVPDQRRGRATPAGSTRSSARQGSGRP